MPGSVFRIGASAKLNLFLAVGLRRPDGFHEVETVTVQLELADQLEFQTGDDVTDFSFSVIHDQDAHYPESIPADDRNLVVRAVKLVAQESGIEVPTAIRLIKRIPSQAGLGGGSSDAAATLVACNELWKLRLEPSKLVEMGALLGSDVPLFLGSIYSISRGRGEKSSPLFNTSSTGYPRLDFVLLKPPFGLNTGEVYSRFDISPVTCPHDVGRLAKALAHGDMEGAGSLLFNAMEKPAFDMRPELEDYKRAMMLPGVVRVLMTGSGSCLFALCQNAKAASGVAQILRVQFPECFVLATASKLSQG